MVKSTAILIPEIWRQSVSLPSFLPSPSPRVETLWESHFTPESSKISSDVRLFTFESVPLSSVFFSNLRLMPHPFREMFMFCVFHHFPLPSSLSSLSLDGHPVLLDWSSNFPNWKMPLFHLLQLILVFYF